jgi:ABC-type molybdate transport system permease subunit
VDLHLWRDIAIIVLTVMGLFFLLGLAVVLYAFFIFMRRAQKSASSALQSLADGAQKLEQNTRKTAKAVVEPLANVSAFQAGILAFFRSLARGGNTKPPKS